MPWALLLLCIATLLANGSAFAQHNTASPYSMYGIGVLTPKEDAASAALGHSSIALASSEWVNISNPAGINQLDSLAFYFTFNLKYFYARHEIGYDHRSMYKANLDGLCMAFRGNKYLTFAFGYSPFSAVGYNITQKRNIVGSDYWYDVTHKGSGGLSQAYFNMALTLFDHLTIGGNFSVLWGTIERKEVADFAYATDGVTYLGGEVIHNERKYSLNNIYWEVGLQYDFNIGKNNFRLGAVYNPKKWLHTSFDHIIYNSVSSELDSDDPTPDRFKVPQAYGAGLTWKRGPYMVTFEYKRSEWSDIPNTKFNEAIPYRDSYTYSGGFEFAPGKPDDPFYKRMRYRLGGYWGKDYIDVTGLDMDLGGVTAGLSIPFGRTKNAITISYEHQERGVNSGGMVKETNKIFKFGVNIREIWFLKSKFD